jgi:molybdopterin converting factor small subunit
VATVEGLLDWLSGRSEGHWAALADRQAVRVAVNQEYARPGDPVRPGDEIALFPPVTGG